MGGRGGGKKNESKNGHFPKHGIWIEINFMSLIINKLRGISTQAQRSNQKYNAFLAPVNHVASTANGSVTKALGLKVLLHISHSKLHNRTGR
jgi:hypothetical protein